MIIKKVFCTKFFKLFGLVVLLLFTNTILAEKSDKQAGLIYQIETQEVIIEPTAIKSIEMVLSSYGEKAAVINYTDDGFEKIKNFINNNISKKVIIKFDNEIILSATIMDKIDNPSVLITGISREEVEKIKKYISKKTN